jgi:small ligand-binding sensory domain FIST
MQPQSSSSDGVERFLLAHGTGADAERLVRECLGQVGPIPAAANLGFVYASDALARDMDTILDALKTASGIGSWVGTVGMALNVTGHEYYDQPALALLIGQFAPDSFRLIPSLSSGTEPLVASEGEWLRAEPTHFGIVHGDPTNPATPTLIEQLAETAGAFLVGGITSSQSEQTQISGATCAGGISGVLFSPEVEVATSHTQGCTPIGPKHLITHSQRNIIAELDGRPALEVFKEDIGDILAKDLNRVAGYIFAGLPIAGSDTGDYLVRNLVGIDTGQQMIAIGDYATQGAPLMFCRRDGNSAREDMLRMLDELKRRTAGRDICGGVYYSCLGRGRHQFGEDSQELKLIEQELGDFPLVGFFANGEVFHNRLYGYTGVLTLFL